jgi:group I intron endonuclease
VGIIYAVRHNEKIIYIGQTIRQLQRRIQSYKSNVRTGKNNYIHNYLRKYFDECEFIILEKAEKQYLDDLEIKYIKEHNTLYPNGLNLTEGGRTPIFSDESRQKMSNSRIGKEPWNKNTKGIMNAWNKGIKTGPQSEEVKEKKKRFGKDNHFFDKKHSEETKKKISESKKAKKLQAHNAYKGKIYKLDVDKQIVCVYETLEEAIQAGHDRNRINESCRRGTKYNGYYFQKEQHGSGNVERKQ